MGPAMAGVVDVVAVLDQVEVGIWRPTRGGGWGWCCSVSDRNSSQMRRSRSSRESSAGCVLNRGYGRGRLAWSWAALCLTPDWIIETCLLWLREATEEGGGGLV